MESIISFKYPSVPLKCVLNSKGRRRYGTLKHLLDTTGTISTVGFTDGSNIERKDIRSSTKRTTIIDIDVSPTEINEQLQRLIPEGSGHSMWQKVQKYDVLEYSKGGFFKKHADNQLSRNHYATLLIFPPAIDEFAHTGGQLIINEGKFIFDSSSNKEWTFIAFHTNLLHECLEVTSGKRIVFKTELYSSKKTLEERQDVYPIMDRGMPI